MKSIIKSKMALAFLFGLFFLAGQINPAQAGWADAYGLTYPRLSRSLPTEDLGFCINNTTDGGYIVAGTTTYDLLSGGGPWVLKLDASGGVQWQKAYISSSADRFLAVEQAADGSYYLAGHTISFGTGDNDLWVMKLDASGNILWQKTLGDAFWNTGRSLALTSDGGVLVGGYVEQTASEDQSNSAAWLVKLDSAGAVQWQKNYRDGANGSAAAWSVRALDDGGAAAAGGYVGTGFETGFAWIMRLDSSGALVWQKGLGHRSSLSAFYFRALSVTADGGFIATGAAENQDEEVSYFFAARYDSAGNLIWQRVLQRNAAYDEGRGVCQTADGGFIIAGVTNMNAMSGLALVKLDSAGAIVWQRKLVPASGGMADVNDLRAVPDGGCVLVGTLTDSNASNDLLVLKVDSDGSLSTGCIDASWESTSEFSVTVQDLEERDTPAVASAASAGVMDSSASASDTSAKRACQ